MPRLTNEQITTKLDRAWSVTSVVWSGSQREIEALTIEQISDALNQAMDVCREYDTRAKSAETTEYLDEEESEGYVRALHCVQELAGTLARHPAIRAETNPARNRLYVGVAKLSLEQHRRRVSSAGL